MTEAFDTAMERFDAENSRDPNQENGRPRELLYAERLTAWVVKLAPDARAACNGWADCV